MVLMVHRIHQLYLRGNTFLDLGAHAVQGVAIQKVRLVQNHHVGAQQLILEDLFQGRFVVQHLVRFARALNGFRIVGEQP